MLRPQTQTHTGEEKLSSDTLEIIAKHKMYENQNLRCCRQRLPSERFQLPCTHFDKILSDQLSMNCLDRAGRSPKVCLRSC